MQLTNGTELKRGDYRIIEVLGQGGFGITYLALQVKLNRKVAIKEFFMKDLCNRDDDGSHVSVGSAGSKDLVERFKQKFLKEAGLIASFDNTNIIRIYDVFEENGTAYYVMEYLEGKSLKALVDESGALPEDVAVKYIRQVAEALKEVHENNLLHLDVKPANIMLDKKGNAVLIDFGISKHYDEAGHQTSSAGVGISEGYAPIEQYEAGALKTFTPVTDIYALGATLFFLLTGARPPKASEVMNVGLPALPGNVSPAVRNAVETAMQPATAKRPQSIGEFLGLVESGEWKDESGEMRVESEETEIVSDATNLSMGTGQNASNSNAAVEENEIEVEVVEVPSAAQKPSVNPNRPKEKKSSKGLWIVILLLLVIGGAAVGFMLLGGSSDVKKDSAKDTSRQIAQKADTPKQDSPLAKETKDTPTIQIEKKDTITPQQQTVAPIPVAEQTTQLKIKGAPNGAYVYVDGNYFGETPLKDATISIGRHTIKVVKEGYESYEKKHTFNSHAAAIDVNLKKTPATLSLATTPGGADVYVDGNYIGTSTISGHKIEQGPHTIKVVKDGYETIENTYTFTSQTAPISLTLTAKPKPQPQNKGIINGHEYVDLGLSVKWATCNVGASKPEEYGNHYAWGETSTKSNYSSDNSVTRGKNFSDIGGNPTYDVARKQWSSTWRLPTGAEFDELLSNCTWTWTTQNGVSGYKVTSKKNGNSIFLPAAGWRVASSPYDQGTRGYYWSSTPRESDSYRAYYLYFRSGRHYTIQDFRNNGQSVRPVCK